MNVMKVCSLNSVYFDVWPQLHNLPRVRQQRITLAQVKQIKIIITNQLDPSVLYNIEDVNIKIL